MPPAQHPCHSILLSECRAGGASGQLLFLDAQTSGVAGDMFVAAAIDLGVPLPYLAAGLAALGLDGWHAHCVQASRWGRRPLHDFTILAVACA